MCAKNTAPVAVAFSRPFISLRSGIVLLFNSARKPLRMNRWCIKIRGGIAKVFRNGSPLSKPSGEEYGQVLSFSAYYHEESKKQLVKVACVSDGRSQVCLLQAKLFNRCECDINFETCKSKDCTALVTELNESLKKIDKLQNSSSDDMLTTRVPREKPLTAE